MRSMPLLFFSVMSMMTRSGRSFLMRVLADSTSSASPQTAKSGSWLMSSLMPRRKIS